MIIYKITNTINGKVYIGKTAHTKEKRFKEHISDSIKPNMKHRPLYRAFNKYGIENFTIEEIDQAKDDEEACQLEQKWILFYNSYHYGYNATLGGDGTRRYDYKAISDYYQKCGSEKDTSQYFKCDPQVVRDACKENNIIIKQNYNRKPIYYIDNNGNKVCFKSALEAAKIIAPNINPESARKNISRALTHNKSAYGYYWKYLDD